MLADLGYACSLTGFVGDDEVGANLLATLQHSAISTDILAFPQWPTYVASSQTAVTDQEAAGATPEQQRILPFNGMSEYQAHMQNRVERGVRNASRLVVVDQGYGSVGDPLATVFAAAQHARFPALFCVRHTSPNTTPKLLESLRLGQLLQATNWPVGWVNLSRDLMTSQQAKPSMVLVLYRLLLWLATPFIVARLWWRGRREPGLSATNRRTIRCG